MVMTTHNNNIQLPILSYLIQFHILSYAWDQSIIESRDAWVWIRCKLPLVCKRYNQHINRVLLHQSLWFNDYNQFKDYLLRLKSNSSPYTSVNDGNDYSIVLPRSLTIQSINYDRSEKYCKEKTFDEWNTVFQECSDQLNMVLSSITSLKTDSSLMYYLISTLNKYNNALLNNNNNNNNSNYNNSDISTATIINSEPIITNQSPPPPSTSTTTTRAHPPKLPPPVPRIKKSRLNDEDDLEPSWKNTSPLTLNSISIICFPYLDEDDEDGFIKELGKIIRSGGTSIRQLSIESEILGESANLHIAKYFSSSRDFLHIESLTLTDRIDAGFTYLIDQITLFTDMYNNGVRLKSLTISKQCPSADTFKQFQEDLSSFIRITRCLESLYLFGDELIANETLEYILQDEKCSVINFRCDSCLEVPIKRWFKSLNINCREEFIESLNNVDHVISDSLKADKLIQFLNTNKNSISLCVPIYHHDQDIDRVILALNQCTTIQYLYNNSGSHYTSDSLIAKLQQCIDQHPSIINKSSWTFNNYAQYNFYRYLHRLSYPITKKK